MDVDTISFIEEDVARLPVSLLFLGDFNVDLRRLHDNDWDRRIATSAASLSVEDLLHQFQQKHCHRQMTMW
jgi:hypothetical protein